MWGQVDASSFVLPEERIQRADPPAAFVADVVERVSKVAAPGSHTPGVFVAVLSPAHDRTPIRKKRLRPC